MNSVKTKKVRKARKKGLTIKEQLALNLYVKNNQYNIGKCMIEAGFPPKAASKQGCELLQNELSVQYIEQIREKALKKYSKEADDVLEEIACLAFSDMANYFHEDDRGVIALKTLKEMGKYSRAIKKIKHKKRVVTGADGEEIAIDHEYEYELYDKVKALDLLAYNHKIKGRISSDRDEDEKSEVLPQIFLPDNGKTGKVAIFVDVNKKD